MATPKKKKATQSDKIGNAASAGFYGGAGASVAKAGVKKGPSVRGAKGVKGKTSAVKANARANTPGKVAVRGTQAKMNSLENKMDKQLDKPSNGKPFRVQTKASNAAAKRSDKALGKGNLPKAAKWADRANKAKGTPTGNQAARDFGSGMKMATHSKTYKSGYKGAAVAAIATGAYTEYKKRTASGKVITVKRRSTKKK